MSFNLPLVLKEHAPTSLAEIDTEIERLVNRVALLVQQRNIIETHLRVQTALDGPVPDSGL